MSGPSVYFSSPPFAPQWPDDLPKVLSPPLDEGNLRAPFSINKELYNFSLKPQVPLIFATTYVTLVFLLNAWNRSRNNRPWWIARQKPWKAFVVLHNVALAVYSLATFVAMARGISRVIPDWNPHNGVAEYADAFCKVHGPRGLGDAVTYNTTINIWETKNMMVHLANGNPDPTDVGRLWNEGLAFWGWFFYLSKFYEVMDTFIIVAKGKRSATLQTYHHAGAMLCMWAGIRFMSPPIWMFVFINSGIHAMMYTYFTLSALGYRVPQTIKRTLTSMQIAQFVFGASYAALHLFIQYDIPIQTPYQVLSSVQSVASTASSAVNSATSTVEEIFESPTAVATYRALIKKLLLRAAGEEGAAERISNDRGHHVPPKVEQKIEQFRQEAQPAQPAEPTYETRWRSDYTKINCLDTTGQAFAVYLNLLYLFPLTVLFARFFIKAYTHRSGKRRSISENIREAPSNAAKAERETKEYIERNAEAVEDEVRRRSSLAKGDPEEARRQFQEDLKNAKEAAGKAQRRVSERVHSYEGKIGNAAEKAKQTARDAAAGGKDSPQQTPSSKQQSGKELHEVAEQMKKSNDSAIEDEPETESPFKPEQKSNLNNEAKGSPSKKKNKNKNKNNNGGQQSPFKPNSSTNAESEKKQEANMAESQDLRPGTGGKATEEEKQAGASDDTDAMGQSGSIVDVAAEKAEEAKEEAKEGEGPGLLAKPNA
ncbi:hypothetical protein MBLNU230_g1866t1 [Neophaeotheca triangularis]